LGQERASARSKESCGSLGEGRPFWFISTTTIFIERLLATVVNAFFLLTAPFWAGKTGFGAS
jgi:hypothetical protein